MCLLTTSSRTEKSFAKQQFAQRLWGNREGAPNKPRMYSSQPSTLQQQPIRGINRSWVFNTKLNSPVLSDTHGEKSQVLEIAWLTTYQSIAASFYSPASRGGKENCVFPKMCCPLLLVSCIFSLFMFLPVCCLPDSISDFRTQLKYDPLNASIFCNGLNVVCPSAAFWLQEVKL